MVVVRGNLMDRVMRMGEFLDYVIRRRESLIVISVTGYYYHELVSENVKQVKPTIMGMMLTKKEHWILTCPRNVPLNSESTFRRLDHRYPLIFQTASVV